MAVVIVCCALVLVGLGLVGWLGGVAPPGRDEGLDDSFATHAPRVAKRLAAATAGGAGAGLLVAGPGGRLVMRLLAVTAGEDAQGRFTEAEQRVGTITVDGTIGLIVFGGVFFGVATGLGYLLVRRWLPRGRLGGIAFGVLLLLVAATRLDPLRPDNEDFDLVGPGWLSVLAFGALALVHGALVAGITNAWERFALGLEGRRSLVGYAPLLAFAPVLPFLLLVGLIGVIATLMSTQRDAADLLASPRALIAGRVGLVALAVVALPSTITDLADIVRRGAGG